MTTTFPACLTNDSTPAPRTTRRFPVCSCRVTTAGAAIRDRFNPDFRTETAPDELIARARGHCRSIKIDPELDTKTPRATCAPRDTDATDGIGSTCPMERSIESADADAMLNTLEAWFASATAPDPDMVRSFVYAVVACCRTSLLNVTHPAAVPVPVMPAAVLPVHPPLESYSADSHRLSASAIRVKVSGGGLDPRFWSLDMWPRYRTSHDVPSLLTKVLLAKLIVFVVPAPPALLLKNNLYPASGRNTMASICFAFAYVPETSELVCAVNRPTRTAQPPVDAPVKVTHNPPGDPGGVVESSRNAKTRIRSPG